MNCLVECPPSVMREIAFEVGCMVRRGRSRDLIMTVICRQFGYHRSDVAGAIIDEAMS